MHSKCSNLLLFTIHNSLPRTIHQIESQLLSMEQLIHVSAFTSGAVFFCSMHDSVKYYMYMQKMKTLLEPIFEWTSLLSKRGPVACLLKTVAKWVDDGAEKILRSDETPNLQLSAAKRNFQSTTLYWKDSEWISWIVSKVLLWPVSDSVNVVLSTAWSSFFTLMGLINFC